MELNDIMGSKVGQRPRSLIKSSSFKPQPSINKNQLNQESTPEPTMPRVSNLDLTPIKHQMENYNRLFINRSTLSRRILNPKKSLEKLNSSPSRMISTRKWPESVATYDHSRSYLNQIHIKNEPNIKYKRITPRTAREPRYRRKAPISRNVTPPPIRLDLSAQKRNVIITTYTPWKIVFIVDGQNLQSNFKYAELDVQMIMNRFNGRVKYKKNDQPSTILMERCRVTIIEELETHLKPTQPFKHIYTMDGQEVIDFNRLNKDVSTLIVSSKRFVGLRDEGPAEQEPVVEVTSYIYRDAIRPKRSELRRPKKSISNITIL